MWSSMLLFLLNARRAILGKRSRVWVAWLKPAEAQLILTGYLSLWWERLTPDQEDMSRTELGALSESGRPLGSDFLQARISLHINGTLWKKPLCFSLPSENSITKDWKSRCWYQKIFPATHRSFSHSPCQKNLRVPARRPFAFPDAWKVFRSQEWHFTCLHAIKVWPVEEDLSWLQGPEFSGIGDCERSHSGGQKTFPALGMQKVSFQGPEKSRRLFWHGRGEKSNSKDIMLQHS